MKLSPTKKPYKGQAHTPKSSKGLGDYYGTGVHAKLGTIRSPTVGMVKMSKKKLTTPPKAIA